MIGSDLKPSDGAYASRGGIAVHIGHLDIHQHRIVVTITLGQHPDGLAAATGDVDAGALVLEQLAGDLLVGRVVLDHQQEHAAQSAHVTRRLRRGGRAGAGASPRTGIGHRIKQHRARSPA